jgi:hypothetical protein
VAGGGFPDLSPWPVELQAALERRLGLRAGLSTIHKALRRIGLRHKKSAEGSRAGPPPGAGAAGSSWWTRNG